MRRCDLLVLTITAIDLIHDTRHLCTRLRTDGRKALSRGFSEGKQVMKISRSRLFIVDNGKWKAFYRKDDNGKLWVEMIIQYCYFLDAVATVDVLKESNNVEKRVKTRAVHFAWLKSWSLFERISDRDNSYWQILSLVFPLKYYVDIAFIPLVLKRLQRWRVSWIRSIGDHPRTLYLQCRRLRQWKRHQKW